MYKQMRPLASHWVLTHSGHSVEVLLAVLLVSRCFSGSQIVLTDLLLCSRILRSHWPKCSVKQWVSYFMALDLVQLIWGCLSLEWPLDVLLTSWLHFPRLKDLFLTTQTLKDARLNQIRSWLFFSSCFPGRIYIIFLTQDKPLSFYKP